VSITLLLNAIELASKVNIERLRRDTGYRLFLVRLLRDARPAGKSKGEAPFDERAGASASRP
jgi:hypothetical protein